MRCHNCGAENIPGIDLCDTCGSDLAGLDLPEAEAGVQGRLLTDRIADLTLEPPVTASAEETVAEAVTRMRETGHGCVLVETGGRLEGIFTERDLLVRVLRRGLDPAAVRLGRVMTPEPFTLSPADPPAFAIHRMVAQGLRHLPVVVGDDLKGFISARNVLRYLHRDVIGSEPAPG